MSNDRTDAPGWPGMPARWTSSAKSGVGTAIGSKGGVWFTVSHGILNEVYYPRLDQACTRDLGFIVTVGRGFFSEEKRHARHEIVAIADGVPAFRVTNTCDEQRYRIEKEILADPRREVVLQQVRLTPLRGTLADYRLFALLAPHVGNSGGGNTAWVGDVKGTPMLFAERDGTALALACSASWSRRSAGFVGASDGWRDLVEHGRMEWSFERAENGNVALTREIDLAASAGAFVLALGFGPTFGAAAHRAAARLLAAGARDGVDQVLIYLAVTQEADGHWPQSVWLDGTPYWNGVQMDETGLPILLVDLGQRQGVLGKGEMVQLWPMVRRAVEFLV